MVIRGYKGEERIWIRLYGVRRLMSRYWEGPVGAVGDGHGLVLLPFGEPVDQRVDDVERARPFPVRRYSMRTGISGRTSGEQAFGLELAQASASIRSLRPGMARSGR